MGDEPFSEHLTVRVSRRLQQDLTATARRRGLATTALARAYLDEGVRMDRYPGVVFRERGGGRRAAIAGRRLDIWQVIETLRASGGSIEETADYLRLRADEVRTALAYAADYPDEIETLIRANREEAEQAHEAEARQRALLGR